MNNLARMAVTNAVNKAIASGAPRFIESPMMPAVTKPITRDNIDSYLDNRSICVATNGKWLRMRRNGATKTWKKDASRIKVPFKYGFKGYASITESDFYSPSDNINPDYYRHVDDIPPHMHT